MAPAKFSITRLELLDDLHQKPIRAVSISPTYPPFLITSSQDSTTCFTDLSDTASRFRILSKGFHVTTVSWSKVGVCFLGWNGGFVTEMIYDVTKKNLTLLSHINARPLKPVVDSKNPGIPSPVVAMSCAGDGRHIVIGRGLIIDVYSRRPTSTLLKTRHHWRRVFAWDGSQNPGFQEEGYLIRGLRLITGLNLQIVVVFRCGEVWVWDIGGNTFQPIRLTLQLDRVVGWAYVSHDGQSLVSSDPQDNIFLFNLPVPGTSLSGRLQPVKHLILSTGRNVPAPILSLDQNSRFLLCGGLGCARLLRVDDLKSNDAGFKVVEAPRSIWTALEHELGDLVLSTAIDSASGLIASATYNETGSNAVAVWQITNDPSITRPHRAVLSTFPGESSISLGRLIERDIGRRGTVWSMILVLKRNLGALLGVIIALLSIATIVSRGEDIYQIVRALAKMGFRAVCDRCTL